MRLTRATEYACLTMLYLAKQAPGTVCFTSDIAERERIPASFLVKVVPRLVRAGLVRSRRGSNGGIELARPAGDISLRDVVEAIEGEIAVNLCTSDRSFYDCFRHGCSIRHALRDAQNAFLDALDRTTLAALARRDAFSIDGSLVGAASEAPLATATR